MFNSRHETRHETLSKEPPLSNPFPYLEPKEIPLPVATTPLEEAKLRIVKLTRGSTQAFKIESKEFKLTKNDQTRLLRFKLLYEKARADTFPSFRPYYTGKLDSTEYKTAVYHSDASGKLRAAECFYQAADINLTKVKPNKDIAIQHLKSCLALLSQCELSRENFTDRLVKDVEHLTQIAFSKYTSLTHDSKESLFSIRSMFNFFGRTSALLLKNQKDQISEERKYYDKTMSHLKTLKARPAFSYDLKKLPTEHYKHELLVKHQFPLGVEDELKLPGSPEDKLGYVNAAKESFEDYNLALDEIAAESDDPFLDIPHARHMVHMNLYHRKIKLYMLLQAKFLKTKAEEDKNKLMQFLCAFIVDCEYHQETLQINYQEHIRVAQNLLVDLYLASSEIADFNFAFTFNKLDEFCKKKQWNRCISHCDKVLAKLTAHANTSSLQDFRIFNLYVTKSAGLTGSAHELDAKTNKQLIDKHEQLKENFEHLKKANVVLVNFILKTQGEEKQTIPIAIKNIIKKDLQNSIDHLLVIYIDIFYFNFSEYIKLKNKDKQKHFLIDALKALFEVKTLLNCCLSLNKSVINYKLQVVYCNLTSVHDFIDETEKHIQTVQTNLNTFEQEEKRLAEQAMESKLKYEQEEKAANKELEQLLDILSKDEALHLKNQEILHEKWKRNRTFRKKILAQEEEKNLEKKAELKTHALAITEPEDKDILSVHETKQVEQSPHEKLYQSAGKKLQKGDIDNINNALIEYKKAKEMVIEKRNAAIEASEKISLDIENIKINLEIGECYWQKANKDDSFQKQIELCNDAIKLFNQCLFDRNKLVKAFGQGSSEQKQLSLSKEQAQCLDKLTDCIRMMNDIANQFVKNLELIRQVKQKKLVQEELIKDKIKHKMGNDWYHNPRVKVHGVSLPAKRRHELKAWLGVMNETEKNLTTFNQTLAEAPKLHSDFTLSPNYISLPPKIQALMSELANEYDVHLHGGAVRDLLIGKQPSDYDLITNAPPDAIKTAMRKLQFDEPRENKMHPEVIMTSTQFDRIEVKSKANFSCTQRGLEKEALTKDFTINALFADQFGRVKDPLHRGLEDLEIRKIVPVMNEEDFLKDPTRILRAVQMSLKGFEMDPVPKHKMLLGKERLIQFNENYTEEDLRYCLKKLFLGPYNKVNKALMNFRVFDMLMPYLPHQTVSASLYLFEAKRAQALTIG